MVKFSLYCWSCGNGVSLEASRLPEFAFEVAGLANRVGMLGVIDMLNGRSLVFCNQDCADKQRKKDGSFRLRPIRQKLQQAADGKQGEA